jgi:glycosidase
VGRENKYQPAPHSLSQTADILKKWQEHAQKCDFLYTLLTDNHDQPWYNSRVGEDKENRYLSATAICLLVYGMKGIPFIYQGQEIGSANSYFDDISAFDDVETFNYYRENEGKMPKEELMRRINYGGRDNTRRPFAWSREKNYGFTTGERAWLPFASRSDEINLERDTASEKSVFEFYKKLFSLRERIPALRYGDFKDVTKGEGFIAYEREYEGEKYLIVCNFERESRVVGYKKGKVMLSNFDLREGEEVSIDRTYSPFESAMFLIK